jgi:peptide subunit release factor 1 (eRF1)
VTTEIARHRQAAAFERLATTLAARLTLLAGVEGSILFGGAAEWSRLASEALPRALQDRILVSPTLHHDASPDDIVRAAKRAARQLRARRGRAIVSHTLGRVGYRAVAGVPALQRALHLNAVDLLLLTPRFLHLERNRAEDLLRMALAQGAEVEVLSGEPATLLDGTAGGVAARLRFAIDRPLDSAGHSAAVQPTSPVAS